MTPDLLARLREAQSAKRPVALLTRLPDGAQFLWPDDAGPVPRALADAAEAAMRDDKAGLVALGGERWFAHPHNPPVRLIVVGAVHVAQALVPMASALGLAVTVVDPRRAFATPERFPGVSLSFDWPDEAMEALALDGRTAVVTLTHDPKLDDPALDVALRSPCFYIGALGSRRTHGKRVARLREMGHGDDAIARIHAPVGLDIAAVTAPEIALSVLAEVVAARRGAALARREPPAAAAPAMAAAG
ncbi:MAG: XdhC family protein [Acetobacteraceae bacterium]|nr:XdhC family protein [Acetobacteraceae bacterium]